MLTKTVPKWTPKQLSTEVLAETLKKIEIETVCQILGVKDLTIFLYKMHGGITKNYLMA